MNIHFFYLEQIRSEHVIFFFFQNNNYFLYPKVIKVNWNWVYVKLKKKNEISSLTNVEIKLLQSGSEVTSFICQIDSMKIIINNSIRTNCLEYFEQILISSTILFSLQNQQTLFHLHSGVKNLICATLIMNLFSRSHFQARFGVFQFLLSAAKFPAVWPLKSNFFLFNF